MPFFSFPQNVNWNAVPADFVTALRGGFQDAFLYGGIPGLNNPPPSYKANPVGLIAGLLEQLVGPISLSSLTDSGPLNDAGDVLAAIDAARIEDGSAMWLRCHRSRRMRCQIRTPRGCLSTLTRRQRRWLQHRVSPARMAQSSVRQPLPRRTRPRTRQRPRLTFGRGRTNSQSDACAETTTDVGSSSGSRLRQSISDTRQQDSQHRRRYHQERHRRHKAVDQAATGGGSDSDDDTDNKRLIRCRGLEIGELDIGEGPCKVICERATMRSGRWCQRTQRKSQVQRAATRSRMRRMRRTEVPPAARATTAKSRAAICELPSRHPPAYAALDDHYEAGASRPCARSYSGERAVDCGADLSARCLAA